MRSLKGNSLSNANAKIELLALLAEKERRVRTRLLSTMYPETGALRRELYAKHMAFFKAGKNCRERCMMAANRVGKSFGAGGYEVTLHVTGLYPDWWEGRRFDHPISCWAAGESAKTTRDTIQKILLGEHRNHGTGLIPADLIIHTTPKHGMPDGVEDIYIKHASGGTSHVGLKSYEQGAGSFMGTEKHLVWLDEESPLDVYTECLTRTMIVPGATPMEKVTGMILLTFTPLYGLSEVVMNFMPDGQLPQAHEIKEKFIIQVTWDEVPHLTREMKDSLWRALPPHERAARSKGTPQLGSGKIYPVPEEEIVIEPFDIPRHWPRFFAMDVGYKTPTAVGWFAWDRECDTLYLYREYYVAEKLPFEHAHVIKQPQAWIPGVIDPASKIGNQKEGVKLMQEYEDLGLKLYVADNAIEAGILKVMERLQTGRLKIFTTCQNWRSEYRLYRRDKHGYVAPKQADHLMDATRYAVASGTRIAITQPLFDEDDEEYVSEKGKSPVGGY